MSSFEGGRRLPPAEKDMGCQNPHCGDQYFITQVPQVSICNAVNLYDEFPRNFVRGFVLQFLSLGSGMQWKLYQSQGPLQKMQTTQEAQGAVEALSFTLGNEEYGINILKVQEIRGYDAVTQIANAPDFIKGVINLRGIIVPIIDMRIKFKLGTPTYDQFTVVIILNIADRVVGMVVDSVSDVISLNPEQIKPAPDMGSALNTDHLIGLGTIDERMVILVDIDRLMSSDEMGLIEKMAA
jgi:purine-binding chemotaxis protein CheW